MKAIIKSITVFISFLILLLGFVYGEPTDDCSDLMWEMKNCSSQFHIPEKCDDYSKQSKLYTCAEAVADKIHLCPDKIAQKIIKYFVTAYQISDQVICQDSMHTEFMNNKNCANLAKGFVVAMSLLTPGFLTAKGCRFFKSALLVSALTQDRNNCYETIKDYVDIMYSKSTCNETKVEAPTMDDVLNMEDVLPNIQMCWILHRRVPNCNGTKSRRLQCVEDETMNRITNKHLKTLEKNIVDVTEMTDKVICENKQLKEDFESHRGCLRYARSLGGYLIAEVNGYYTEEGCEGLQYREKYKLAIVNVDCRPILQTYWNEMKKVLPCTESSAGKISFSLIIPIITFLTTFLM